MTKLRDVAEHYPVIAMDTLLPGTVARPIGPFGSYADYNYQTLKCNVDLTRVIQIGLMLYDSAGHRPKGISTWRFNFAFDAGEDQFSLESIDRLRQSCGLDLGKHHSQGIKALQFGELLMSSGLVLNEDIRWIMFGGANSFSERPPEARSVNGRPVEPPWVTFCGIYNFGYLLQLLTAESLPEKAHDFRESLDLFFPSRCNMARHLHQLQSHHPLITRDPADPQQRPHFCSAQHVLDAFFRLPDAVRKGMFDGVADHRDPLFGDEPPTAPRQQQTRASGEAGSRRNGTRRRPRSGNKRAGTESAVVAMDATSTLSMVAGGAGNLGGAAGPPHENCVNGAAKTGNPLRTQSAS